MHEAAGTEIVDRGRRRSLLVRRLRVATPAIAFLAALGVALALVLSQPVSSPWWVSADADAIYTTSGLNLLLGKHTFYLDHPGLPEEEALEAVFGAQYLVEKATGIRSGGVHSFADHEFLDLDRTRPVYRSLAVVFYLLGVALAFVLTARLLGHWTWGLGASLLWLAAPGLLPISIQIRPDGLLCALVLLSAYLVARAAERRDAWLFGLAAASIGFATTVKLHAAGLAPVLLAAVAWRHPGREWPASVRESAARAWRRRRGWVVPLGALLPVAAVAFNLDRPGFAFTRTQLTLLLTVLALVAGYGACAVLARRLRLLGADRLFDPFVAVLAVATLCGLAVPIVLDPEDGFQMLVSIKDTLVGHGVNQGIVPFSQLSRPYLSYPLLEGLMVFVAAVAAAVVGVVRRAPVPVVFALASAVLAVMALARYQQTYYLAPAYVAAIPAALWLFRGRRSRSVPLFVWPLLAIVVLPQVQHRNDLSHVEAAETARAAALERTVAPLLQPDVVVLTPLTMPDTAFAEAQFYGSYTPVYPYRFVSPWPPFIQLVQSRGLDVRYYAGPQALQVHGVTDVDLAGLGTFRVRRLTRFDRQANGFGVLEILRAPPGL